MQEKDGSGRDILKESHLVSPLEVASDAASHVKASPPFGSPHEVLATGSAPCETPDDSQQEGNEDGVVPPLWEAVPAPSRSEAPALATLQRPATHSAACQTDEGDYSSREAQAVQTLRGNLARLRNRYLQMETRLNSEGAILLRKFRQHQAQLATAVSRGDMLTAHRDSVRERLLARLESSRLHLLVRVVWNEWRCRVAGAKHAKAMLRGAAVPRNVPLAAGEGFSTMDGEDGGVDGNDEEEDDDAHSNRSPPVLLPPPISRRGLYRLSYEALIDQVLHLQDALYANAGLPMPEIPEEDLPTPPRSAWGASSPAHARNDIAPMRARSAERRRCSSDAGHEPSKATQRATSAERRRRSAGAAESVESTRSGGAPSSSTAEAEADADRHHV